MKRLTENALKPGGPGGELMIARGGKNKSSRGNPCGGSSPFVQPEVL